MSKLNTSPRSQSKFKSSSTGGTSTEWFWGYWNVTWRTLKHGKQPDVGILAIHFDHHRFKRQQQHLTIIWFNQKIKFHNFLPNGSANPTISTREILAKILGKGIKNTEFFNACWFPKEKHTINKLWKASRGGEISTVKVQIGNRGPYVLPSCRQSASPHSIFWYKNQTYTIKNCIR